MSDKRIDIDKVAEVRRTAIRGLKPTTVFLIAAMVMMSGFAVSSIDQPKDEKNPAEPAVVDAGQLAPSLTPAQERAQLLSDRHALHRATMWLARVVYSESYKRHEQELVAWVVRNRVETRYRDKSTYRSVATDPYQFSAFNEGSITRDFLLAVDTSYSERGWRQAVEVARSVIHADPEDRPFPITVRHFYSEQSLGGAEAPEWALDSEPVDLERFEIDVRRFRFYNGVS